jgi:hypothetical protein
MNRRADRHTSADSVSRSRRTKKCRLLAELYRACAGLSPWAKGRASAASSRGRSSDAGAFDAHREPARLCAPPAERRSSTRQGGIAAGGRHGKIEDLFAGRGVTHAVHRQRRGRMDWVEEQIRCGAASSSPTSPISTRNSAIAMMSTGYARNLEADVRLSKLLPQPRRRPARRHGRPPRQRSDDHEHDHARGIRAAPVLPACPGPALHADDVR